jgi:hypothetical protein
MTEETINEIKWTIHETHPDKVKEAREKLVEVVDPEIGMTIIQLGLVRDIIIENDIARVKMILTTPFCPVRTCHDRDDQGQSHGRTQYASDHRDGHGYVGLFDDGRPIRAGLGHVRLKIVTFDIQTGLLSA